MNVGSEITVGAIAIVKVGRNEVEVTVTGITERGWMVKSRSTGREFEVRRIERIVEEPSAEEAEPETEENAVNPASESGSGPRPEKKLSLLNAAAQVLAACREPMNCKEIIAKAVEMGLWIPTEAKTPEQTLYSGIFREIKIAAEPRFKKSETRKGSFEYARER